MEDKRILKQITKLVLALLIITIPYQAIIGYETNIHAILTQKAIELYNTDKEKKNELEKYKQYIIQGSIDEDTHYLTRPEFHFYDPTYSGDKTGYLHKRISSMQWAQSALYQAKKGGDPVKEDEKLFSSSQDYSFQKAIYEYVYNDDKQKAYYVIGHIMHLLQDKTSPPHVRNDSHLNYEGYGDISPYEKHTANKTYKDLSHINANPKQYNSLDILFYDTALYTNKNFLARIQYKKLSYIRRQSKNLTDCILKTSPT